MSAVTSQSSNPIDDFYSAVSKGDYNRLRSLPIPRDYDEENSPYSIIAEKISKIAKCALTIQNTDDFGEWIDASNMIVDYVNTQNVLHERQYSWEKAKIEKYEGQTESSEDDLSTSNELLEDDSSENLKNVCLSPTDLSSEEESIDMEKDIPLAVVKNEEPMENLSEVSVLIEKLYTFKIELLKRIFKELSLIETDKAKVHSTLHYSINRQSYLARELVSILSLSTENLFELYNQSELDREADLADKSIPIES